MATHDEPRHNLGDLQASDDLTEADERSIAELPEAIGCAHHTALHHRNGLVADGRVGWRRAGRAKLGRVASD